MKLHKVWILIGVIILMITGCSMRKFENEKNNMDISGKESETVLNCFFPNLDNSWVGDVMAQCDEDGIHLNYLYETDSNGTGYHPIYRFDTNDFCQYVSKGEIIPFADNIEEHDIAVGTGSFIKAQDGTYHCFYTGHNDYVDTLENPIDRECIMHASSSDNVNYTKHPEDTFGAPEGYSTNDFRDPQVIWNEKDGEYVMLVSAIPLKENGSSILKYTSKDLDKWEYEGEFYHDNNMYFMECPDLISIGDWYYLFYSWDNVSYYRMSRSLEGNWIRPEIDTFDGNGVYAAKTASYEGSNYLIGFLNHKKRDSDKLQYTWSGSLITYELEQKEDCSLGVKMPHQYDEYFATGKRTCLEMDHIDENRDLGVIEHHMLLDGNVFFENERDKLSFVFARTDDNPDGYRIVLDCGSDSIYYDAYYNSQKINLEAGKVYGIKVLIEDEIIVVYINEDKAFSNRIYSAVGNSWEISLDGNTRMSDVKLYSK